MLIPYHPLFPPFLLGFFAISFLHLNFFPPSYVISNMSPSIHFFLIQSPLHFTRFPILTITRSLVWPSLSLIISFLSMPCSTLPPFPKLCTIFPGFSSSTLFFFSVSPLIVLQFSSYSSSTSFSFFIHASVSLSLFTLHSPLAFLTFPPRPSANTIHKPPSIFHLDAIISRHVHAGPSHSLPCLPFVRSPLPDSFHIQVIKEGKGREDKTSYMWREKGDKENENVDKIKGGSLSIPLFFFLSIGISFVLNTISDFPLKQFAPFFLTVFCCFDLRIMNV